MNFEPDKHSSPTASAAENYVLQNLSPRHVDDLRSSGLSDETIAAIGFRSVDEATLRRRLGRDNIQGGGLVIPYPGTDLIRVKPDNPPRNAEGKLAKYLSPKGAANRLFVPPSVRSMLSEPAIPLVITEGEKKAAKAAQENIPCIGLIGVWGWAKDNAAIDDFNGISFVKRDVRLVFDSDTATNPKVLAALDRLAAELNRRGASVTLSFLPSDNGAKVGVDDFLIKHSANDFNRLARAAWKNTEGKFMTTVSVGGKAVDIESAESKDGKSTISVSCVDFSDLPPFTDTADLRSQQRRSQVAGRLSDRFGLADPKNMEDALLIAQACFAERSRFERHASVTKDSSKPKDPLEDCDDTSIAWAREFLRKAASEKQRVFLADMRELGLVGEQQNIQILFYATVSRLSERPLNVEITGTYSSGKSHLANLAVSLLPEGSVLCVTTITDAALVYLCQENPRALKHKVLSKSERPKLMDGQQDVGSLMFREIAETGRATRFLSVKGPNGKFEAVKLTAEGPICFLETTTNETILGEDLSRTLEIVADDSSEQTDNVNRAVAEEAESDDPERAIRQWKITQRYRALHALLEKRYLGENFECLVPRIRVPFASQFRPRGKNLPTDARRLFKHALTLIRVIALLDIPLENSAAKHSATLEHYQIAYDLLEPSAKRALGSADKTLIDAHKKILDWGNAKIRQDGTGGNICDLVFTMKDVKGVLECHDRTAYRRLNALEAVGRLDIVSEHPKKRYKLRSIDPDAVSSVLPTPSEVAAAIAADKLTRTAQPLINAGRESGHVPLTSTDKMTDDGAIYPSAGQSASNANDAPDSAIGASDPLSKPDSDQPRHRVTPEDGTGETGPDLTNDDSWQ